MKEFLALAFSKGELHHAYVLEGESAAVASIVESFLKENNLPYEGSADYDKRVYENFSIEDARVLKESAVSKAFLEGKRIFFLDVGAFNREAEHALLKLFEEPLAGTHFFIRMNDSSHLLPTLLSRVIVLKDEHTKTETSQAKSFLKLSVKDRLAYVTKMVASHDKDESSFALKHQARSLIRSLATHIHQQGTWKTDPKHAFYLEELAKADEFLHQQGASAKLLLEHLALILP